MIDARVFIYTLYSDLNENHLTLPVPVDEKKTIIFDVSIKADIIKVIVFKMILNALIIHYIENSIILFVHIKVHSYSIKVHTYSTLHL